MNYTKKELIDAILCIAKDINLYSQFNLRISLEESLFMIVEDLIIKKYLYDYTSFIKSDDDTHNNIIIALYMKEYVNNGEVIFKEEIPEEVEQVLRVKTFKVDEDFDIETYKKGLIDMYEFLKIKNIKINE